MAAGTPIRRASIDLRARQEDGAGRTLGGTAAGGGVSAVVLCLLLFPPPPPPPPLSPFAFARAWDRRLLGVCLGAMATTVGGVEGWRRRRRLWRPRRRMVTAAGAAVAAAVIVVAVAAAFTPAAAVQTLRLFLLYPSGDYKAPPPLPANAWPPAADDAASVSTLVDGTADAGAAVDRGSVNDDGRVGRVGRADSNAGSVGSSGGSGGGSGGDGGNSGGGGGDDGASLAATASSRQIVPVAPGALALARMLLDATLLGLADAAAPGGVLPPSALTLDPVSIDTQANLLVGTQIMCRTLSGAAPADAYAMVGPLESDMLWLATVTAYQWNLPIVSSTATALALNAVDDSELWPVNATSSSGKPTSYLFHTVPRDDLRVKAMLDLVIRMKRKRDAARARRPWSVYKEERIGVLFSEDQFGQSGMYAIFRRLASAIATSPTGDLEGSVIPLRIVRKLPIPVSGDARLQLRDLRAADVRIIVVWSNFLVPGAAATLLAEADSLGMLGVGYQWIVTASGQSLLGPDSGVDAALARKAVGMLTVEPTVPAGRLDAAPARSVLGRLAAAGRAVTPPDAVRAATIDTFAPYALYAYDAASALARAAAAVAAAGGFPVDGDSARFATEACHWGAAWSGGEAFHRALSGVAFSGLSGDFNFSVPYAARGASYVVQNLQLAPRVAATTPAAASSAAPGATVSPGATGDAVSAAAADAGVRWVDLLRYDLPAVEVTSSGSSGDVAAATDLALGNRAGVWSRMRVGGLAGAAPVRQVFPGLRRLYPSDRPIIRSRKLKVLTQHAPPFVIHKTFPDGTESFSGLSLELWNRVAEALLVDYELSSISATAPSNSMVDAVVNGTVDLALSWTTITAERVRRVSFSQPYYYLGLRFLVRADSVKVELSSLARPFSSALWLLVAASVVVFAVLLHWFEGDDSEDADFRGAASLPSAFVNAIYHAGLTLVQDREYAPVTVEGRVITFGYVFFALIIVSSYAAELFSFLTFSKTELVVSSLADLRNNKVPLSRVGIETGGSVQSYIEEEILGCFPNCPRPPKAYATCISSKECYDKLESREVQVVVNDAPVLEYRAQTDCDVRVVGEPFYDQGYGIMQRSDPDLVLVDGISNAILRLQEDGYLQQLDTRWFGRSACPSATGEDDNRLGVGSLSSIFIFMGVVFVLAAVFHVLNKHFLPFRRALAYLRVHPRPPGRGRRGIKLLDKAGRLNDNAFESAASVGQHVRGPRGAHRPPSVDDGSSAPHPDGKDGVQRIAAPGDSFDIGGGSSSSTFGEPALSPAFAPGEGVASAPGSRRRGLMMRFRQRRGRATVSAGAGGKGADSKAADATSDPSPSAVTAAMSSIASIPPSIPPLPIPQTAPRPPLPAPLTNSSMPPLPVPAAAATQPLVAPVPAAQRNLAATSFEDVVELARFRAAATVMVNDDELPVAAHAAEPPVSAQMVHGGRVTAAAAGQADRDGPARDGGAAVATPLAAPTAAAVASTTADAGARDAPEVAANLPAVAAPRPPGEEPAPPGEDGTAGDSFVDVVLEATVDHARQLLRRARTHRS